MDFFCGAGGMSWGLQHSGIPVRAGVDNSEDCQKTYTSNLPHTSYILRDIECLCPRELANMLGLSQDDPQLVLVGCSPCQFWTKLRTEKRRSRKSAHLLSHFQRHIEYLRPGYVVVENVPGLVQRKRQSSLNAFLHALRKGGYRWADGVINAKHYGVPQNRFRYLLMATRIRDTMSLPLPEYDDALTVRAFIGVEHGFPAIPAGFRDESGFLHTSSGLSAQNLRRIQSTPKSGGTRAAWSTIDELQIQAYRGRDEMFRDVYGRMCWERPAPTITTRFNSLSNGRFGHPEEDRALSLREGATLQTFPKTFSFHGSSISALARQIGNAVPPELARRIGMHLVSVNNNG